MSKNFEVYPTNVYIPKYKDIIENAVIMLNDYLKPYSKNINNKIIVKEVDSNNIIMNPIEITCSEKNYNDIEILPNGNIYIYYHKLTEMDKNIFKEEINNNSNANKLTYKINKNFEIGYFWQIKRSAGQPALVNLLYGFIAEVIAKETEGIIMSDDGAWRYETFPIDWKDFKMEYLNINKPENYDYKETIINLIEDI